MSKLPPTVFIERASPSYVKLFQAIGFKIVYSVASNPDLVCFTGGEDVTPSYYGAGKHPRTHNSELRDQIEKRLFQQAVSMGIDMVGICRGGQFLNVMNGGKMYQDVSRHTQDHVIVDRFTNERIFATSTHHQMMIPGPGSVVVATAMQGGFKEYVTEEGEIVREKEEENLPDTEIVYYDKTASLCFQPHPEFGTLELQEYFKNLLSRIFFL
ncbi:MAG TPA: gamma-glutamyl-gamma-aminobutyrate hydrolase family protein [Methanosarcina sp.]|nr:gamma-glutamyl-gamma-aminobutyrate hydrolase family protein [Methanosarcina sp.]